MKNDLGEMSWWENEMQMKVIDQKLSDLSQQNRMKKLRDFCSKNQYQEGRQGAREPWRLPRELQREHLIQNQDFCRRNI